MSCCNVTMDRPNIRVQGDGFLITVTGTIQDVKYCEVKKGQNVVPASHVALALNLNRMEDKTAVESVGRYFTAVKFDDDLNKNTKYTVGDCFPLRFLVKFVYIGSACSLDEMDLQVLSRANYVCTEIVTEADF